METKTRTVKELLIELEEVQRQLYEANETIDAIRTGQIDALIVQKGSEHQLYSLKTADHLYRVFIEKMTEGALTVNEDGIVLYSNSQFAAMVGLPLSQIMGIPFSEFVSPESISTYEILFESCWKQDCKGELTLKNHGELVPVLLSSTKLDLEDGVSLSFLLTDLTFQKDTLKQLEAYNFQLEQMNRSLEESNHDLQQFASVASHDLQEPLRKIQMFANSMNTKWGDTFSEEQARYLNKVIASAGRMKTLIVDVLNYSKLSANERDYTRTDLNAVLQDILEDFELVIDERKATIVSGNLPVVEANYGQLRQVFHNLISNALKFSKTSEAPGITITSKRIKDKSFDSIETQNGDYCLISVKDNGIGFDEKYIPNVFSLFERLHTKDKYEGSGIGLAITKKIVEKHNGIIDVKSSEDHGADFRIILPMKQL
jgi:PAS domain S-box-containing protein